jgi:hypothetical protein
VSAQDSNAIILNTFVGIGIGTPPIAFMAPSL